MAKVRISFDFDLQKIAPEANMADMEAAAKAVFADLVLHPARKAANAGNIAIRQSDAPFSEKQQKMAELIRATMLTLSAEASMVAQRLPDDVVIQTNHPVELAA